MTQQDSSLPISELSLSNGFLKRFNTLIRNPITIKELRSRMRGGRAFVLLTIHVLLLSVIVALIYGSFALSSTTAFGPDSRDAGKVIFGSVIIIETFVVLFVAPAFTAGAISGEKERQTYDILRTTLLSARHMVRGKLLSALSYVILLLIAAIPLQSVAFFLGGVSVEEVVISQLMLMVGAVTFCTMGLYFSSVMRSTLAATVTTLTLGLFLTAGIPMLVGIFTSFLGPFLFGFSSPSWTVQAALIYFGIGLAALNLPASLIIGEVILLQENTLWAFQATLDSTHKIWIPSTWYLFIIVYSFLAWLFFWLAVRRVNRIANQ